MVYNIYYIYTLDPLRNFVLIRITFAYSVKEKKKETDVSVEFSSQTVEMKPFIYPCYFRTTHESCHLFAKIL